MSDKYYRLICLIVNVCPEPLRELFLKLAKSDPSRPYIDLQAYLTLRHHAISQLKGRRIIRDDQYDLIFPQVGSPDTSAWDVTLLVILIKNLFRVQPLENLSLDEIRTVRNDLQHLPNTSTITDADYDNYWGRLDSATTFLARQASGATYESIIVEKIQKTRCNNMPNLGDTLRYFYDENIKRNNKETVEKMAEMSEQMTLMQQHMNEMKENEKKMTEEIQNLQSTIKSLENKTDSVAANSTQSKILLRNATVTKSGPNGEKVKRFKTVDDILCRLIKNLCATMKSDLPENFTPPTEIADIRTKLRDSHHVIIAGSRNSLNLATAVFVIKDIKYDQNRCVEMKDASEWRHIDPEDVDLVLCRDPFGKPLYDARKTSSMVDIFDSIHHAVRPRDGRKHLDFIIVTDVDCLNALKATRDHDLLEEVVLLSTTENHPVDLTTATYKSPKQNGSNVDFTRYMTSTIIDNYSKNLSNIDHAKLEEARELLRRQRMVAISGPAKSGKTSISVALAKSYMPDEVLFLNSPDDIRSIDFQKTLLVVIDDFGGKYRFDWMKVNEWLACFDLLHEAVTAGKLNLVVTCETKKLQNCIKKVAMHPLLSNQLQLTKIKVLVKPEPSENGITSDISHCSSLSNPLSGTSVGVSGDDVRSVQPVGQYSVRIDRDKMSCFIFGCFTLPGGEILLADHWNKSLKKLDSAYNVTSVCFLPFRPFGVCYIGNNVAVVIVRRQLVYVDVSSMTGTKTVTTDHWSGSITCHNDKLFVTSDGTVYMYTLDGNNRSTLFTCQNSSLFYLKSIAVSGDGNKIYITGDDSLITIDSFGNLLNTRSLPDAGAIAVDDRGNVWVGDLSDNKLYQVSANGARLLGTVSVEFSTQAMSYDTDRSSLILTGNNENIQVIRLD